MTARRDIENRYPITGALMLATLMMTLDSTIANVALPHMMGSVSASQDQITWVLTSYIIASAIMTPLSGWLSQKFGRKPVLMLSIAAFTVASMLCGVATNLPEIVLFRLLQGIAGAALMPLSQAVMLDIYEPREIPQVMSIWSAAVIIGPIIGPALGGWLTENLSWRWVFFINLPIGIAAFVTLFLFMGRDEGGRQRPFDFLGFGALLLFVGSFQLMLDRGPTQDWFNSGEIWIEAVLGVIGCYVFVIQTLSAKHPFFDRALARDSNFVSATVFGFFVGAMLFSTTALLPTMMQNLLGYTALQSGYASVPRGIGSLIAFLSVPRLVVLLGARRVLVVGLAGCTLALWQMSHFDLSMTAGPIMLSGLIQGFGTGLLFAPLTILAYATLSPVHRVEGTIVNTMARSLGSSVGISALQAMLVNQTAQEHSVLSGNIQPGDPVVSAGLPAFFDPRTSQGLTALNGEITRQAAMVAYDAVFATLVLTCFGIVPLLFMMRPPKAVVMSAEEMAAD
ncbi:MAG: DHA2 family efflux MFS transporter permease subunit [Caulobacterales bacterium]